VYCRASLQDQNRLDEHLTAIATALLKLPMAQRCLESVKSREEASHVAPEEALRDDMLSQLRDAVKPAVMPSI